MFRRDPTKKANKAKLENKTHLLGLLPVEMWVNITRHLNETSDLANLAKASHFFHGIVRKDFQGELKKRALQKLLQHVVYGEQDEAEAMIASNPDLLLVRARVTDYSGRTIEGTPFQMALGAEDEEMAEMIKPYLDKINSEEKHIQYREQFPEGWKATEKERHQRDIAALEAVVAAIGASQTNADCEGALETFRAYLEAQKDTVITTGKHSNIQLLISGLKLCDRSYVAFGDQDDRKNNLFWRQVIGTIQRFLPACTAQAFCQGIHKLGKGEKLVRNLEFRRDISRNSPLTDDTGQRFPLTYFPLTLEPNLRLGYDYGIQSRTSRPANNMWLTTPYLQLLSPVKPLAKYVEKKQQRLENIFRIDSAIVCTS